jgi:protease-4
MTKLALVRLTLSALALVGLCGLPTLFGNEAAAQPADIQYAEEPTGGVNIPTAPRAGEFDAFALVTNPAGLHFLRGSHLGVALDFADEDDATAAGPGGGVFLSNTLGGKVLPRIGWGIGLEFLRPSRINLDPDPGTPARFTLGMSTAIGKDSSLGFSWHRFFDEEGRTLAGESTYDLGFATRAGAYWAAGIVVRDLFQPKVASIPVQRRYEVELAARPFATDRLELALGGRVGEIRGDFDGWFRFNLKVMRGLFWRGQLLAQTLHEIDRTGTALMTNERAEYRVTTGFEISLGSFGAAGYLSGAIDSESGARPAEDDFRFRGGSIALRASSEEIESILPEQKRIERIELRGALGEGQLTNLIARLRGIERDDNVVAVFVHLDGILAGWASLDEVRRSLAKIKKSGKKLFFYMVAGNTRQYYLASVADKVWLDPAGGLRIQGFSGTTIYFKGLFEKLGVEAQFEKIEEYKSAPEAFTRTGPTEPAFRMRNELYDAIYDTLTSNIAKSRGIDVAKVKKLIDDGPYTAGDLEKIPELIDAVVLPDDIPKLMAEELGTMYPIAARPNVRPEHWSVPKIAIVQIVGDIVGGESSNVPLIGRKLVGGDTIAKALVAARADPQVKAIILRINSPGGSALASEIMAREVFKTRGKKPIICSMSDIAASGGYFAAAGCDSILAGEMTITGSIGIFNGKFDLSAMLGRLGITWTTFKRGSHADQDTYFRPYTDEERARMKEKLHYFYGRFTKAVAEGRGLTVEQVDEVGRGHVWAGSTAKTIKLVDKIGGLDEAITLAKQSVGMTDDELIQLDIYPKQTLSLLKKLFGNVPGLTGKSDARALLDSLVPGSARGLWDAIPGSLWAEPDTPQARLPYAIVWD